MKTVSATEAKNRLGALIGEVAATATEVVIENHGRPRAVLIAYDEYRTLLEARDQQQRREAMDALRGLRQAVLEQNKDLTGEAADCLIDELSAEVRALTADRLRTERSERVG